MDCSPEHVPDVFAGSPVLAALQVRAAGGEIVVRGNLARGTWEQRIRVPAAEPGEGNAAVVKLYARERVADLEMRWTIGQEVKAIDQEIESLGMVFQVATRRTSWVAIDDDRSVDPRLGSRHEEIPQELPYGTTMASFGGPSPGGPVPPPAARGLAMPPAAMMPMARSLSAPMPRALSAPRPAMGRVASAPPPEEIAAPSEAYDEPFDDDTSPQHTMALVERGSSQDERKTLRPAPPPSPSRRKTTDERHPRSARPRHHAGRAHALAAGRDPRDLRRSARGAPR